MLREILSFTVRRSISVALLAAIVLMSFPLAPPAHAQDDETETNKATVLRIAEEIYNQQAFDLIDELVDPGYVTHERDGMHEAGIDGYRADLEETFASFPDFQITVQDIIAEGDRVVVRYTASSEVAQLSVEGIYIARLADGKLVEDWDAFDDLGLMIQLGVLPPMDEMMGPEIITVAEGLNGPMGVLVDPDGNVWVIDSGIGGDQPLAALNP
ncbi:MAG: SnoaL-like domain-containing protein, partial [Caldilineaceae bacterium]|nr:SnoaL-like domain-containing protein [Caldilineaceae bacterium]